MSASLKAKTVNGVFWNGINRFSVQGISFVFGIVLARLLSPSDYGLVGMVTVFVAISQAFVNSGFSSALIRKQDRTEVDNSTTFYFNIVVGIVCYFILFLVAPFIANFYNTPILTYIIRVIGLGILLNSLCIVQNALLAIKLDFKTPAKISVIGTIISGIVGVILAYLDYGVWALVVQGLVNSIIGTILLWSYAKWRPKEHFSKNSFKQLFGFGSKMLASGLIDTTYNNIYPIIIGKKFAASDLGLYSRADGWAQLPATSATGIIQGVTFPVLSSIQDDDIRLSNDYRRLLRMAAFIVFPIMIGMAAVADPLIRVLITDKWSDCIVLLQILCFGLMWYPIHAINLNLLQVKGRSDLFLKLEVLKKIIGIVTLFITVPLGILAMCFGRVVTSIISLVLNTYYTGKLLHLGFLKQMLDLLPILLNSIVMGILMELMILNISTNIIKLLVGVVFGFLYYVISSKILKSKELSELTSVIKMYVNKINIRNII